MDELGQSISGIKAELVERAREIAREFMSSRTGRQRARDNWSDLVIRVRHNEREGFSVEWMKRVWGNIERRHRYSPQHVPAKNILRHAKDHEHDEVARTKKQLEAIKSAYRNLAQIERTLGRVGQLGDEADRRVGFIPERKKPRP